MNGAYPAAYREFLALFNTARYFEAHDVLEEHWRQDRQPFFKGLIQFAVGLHHWSRGNRKGAAALLARAQDYLAPYAPAYMGLNVAAALTELAACRAAVAAGSGWRPTYLLGL